MWMSKSFVFYLLGSCKLMIASEGMIFNYGGCLATDVTVKSIRVKRSPIAKVDQSDQEDHFAINLQEELDAMNSSERWHYANARWVAFVSKKADKHKAKYKALVKKCRAKIHKLKLVVIRAYALPYLREKLLLLSYVWAPVKEDEDIDAIAVSKTDPGVGEFDEKMFRSYRWYTQRWYTVLKNTDEIEVNKLRKKLGISEYKMEQLSKAAKNFGLAQTLLNNIDYGAPRYPDFEVQKMITPDNLIEALSIWKSLNKECLQVLKAFQEVTTNSGEEENKSHANTKPKSSLT